MKKISLLFTILALLGLGVACDRGMDRGDGIEREEMSEEFHHEVDEMGDNLEETRDEVMD